MIVSEWVLPAGWLAAVITLIAWARTRGAVCGLQFRLEVLKELVAAERTAFEKRLAESGEQHRRAAAEADRHREWLLQALKDTQDRLAARDWTQYRQWQEPSAAVPILPLQGTEQPLATDLPPGRTSFHVLGGGIEEWEKDELVESVRRGS